MTTSFNKIIALTLPASIPIAVAYIQGYWGSFDISPYSTITLMELVGYAIPIIFSQFIALTLLFSINFMDFVNIYNKSKTSKVRFIGDLLLILLFVLMFMDNLIYILIFGSVLIHQVTYKFILKHDFKQLSLISNLDKGLIYMVFILTISSYFYGSYKAQNILKNENNSAEIKMDSDIINVKIIGKVGENYYYIFNNQIISKPSNLIEQIKYEKIVKYEQNIFHKLGTRFYNWLKNLID